MKEIKKKKRLLIVCFAASVILILAGIVVISGCFGDWGSSPSGWPSSIGTDYGYGVFGADFYSYVVNNSAIAGYSAHTAAWNTYDILQLLQFSVGIFMICFGLGSFCVFDLIFIKIKKQEKEMLETPDIPIAPETKVSIAQNTEEIEEKSDFADDFDSLTKNQELN